MDWLEKVRNCSRQTQLQRLAANTVLRDVSAINGFLNFVIRKGFTAYKIPPKSMPKEVRNFRAYIFTDTEIEKMLDSADHFPVCMQNPVKKYQIPVMFHMLFNCGLRTSELLNLRVCDVDFTEKVLAIRDTKFHKSRLVPFTDAVAIPLANYLELFPPASNEAILFASCCSRSKGERYGASWIHTQFRTLLRMSEIPYGGPDRGPRPHDMRHTFAVHCLNSWVLVGEDLTAGLPVLSRSNASEAHNHRAEHELAASLRGPCPVYARICKREESRNAAF
mgnify:CR=1 FL=1